MSPYCIEIGLVILSVLLFAVDAIWPTINRKVIPWAAIGGTALALLLLLAGPGVAGAVPEYLQPYYGVDGLALFYKGFALLTTLVVLVIALEADPVVANFTGNQGAATRIPEFYILPLIICAGMMWMASAKDLVSVFVPLELVTISFYVMVAFARRSALSLEAGVKYLILGALSTGILVYGIAWVYGATGSMSFAGIATAAADPKTSGIALMFGAALLLAGLGFKVAAAPFHVWVPDVYQGAPTPVTAFLSVGSKAAGFIVLTRTVAAFTGEGSQITVGVESLLLWAGVLTVVVGSLAAITQTNLKRLFGYSSISHAGFLLMALGCGTSERFGLTSGGIVAFYLATYLPMTLLGFLLLATLRSQGVAEDIKGVTGLAKRSPGMAFALTVALASMAGLPLTAGFFGKMLVFVAAVDRGFYVAVGLAVVGAAAGFYYYFKPILAAWSNGGSDAATPLKWTALARTFSAVLVIAIVVLGVCPRALQGLLKEPAAPAAVTVVK